ncbi:MAG: cohesin domain-containing protein [Patescibacteria group bacterium]
MKTFLSVSLCILFFMFYVTTAHALTFDLIAPSGELVRGQDVKFTINVDTEEKSLSSTSIGMTYETQYLEYVSVTPGDTFTTVSADVQGDGKFIITGTSTTPYSGSGVFAYVTYKLIATGPGSTKLCALYNPSTPTSTPGPSPTPGGPTSPPAPTALPKTGENKSAVQGVILASLFFVAAGISLFVFKKT